MKLQYPALLVDKTENENYLHNNDMKYHIFGKCRPRKAYKEENSRGPNMDPRRTLHKTENFTKFTENLLFSRYEAHHCNVVLRIPIHSSRSKRIL